MFVTFQPGGDLFVYLRDHISTRTSGFLFPCLSELYQKDRGTSVSKWINNLSRRLGIDATKEGDVCFHGFRHTINTRLADAGTGSETRKLLFGHTTDDVNRGYNHSDVAQIEAIKSLQYPSVVRSCLK